MFVGIDPGSVPEQIGMESGDYLLELNGKNVADLDDLKHLLASVGIIQELKIWRNGSIMVLSGINKFIRKLLDLTWRGLN